MEPKESTLAPGEEEMMHPDLVKWFKEQPTVEDALKMDRESKKKFVKNYYQEDLEMDEAIENGLEKAEDLIDKELEAGKGKHPFSENLIIGLIELSKLKAIEEMIDDVAKLYASRRKKVKGKEITDPSVIMITQMYMAQLAMALQSKLVKQIEDEVKSRDLPLNQIMQIAVGYLIGDVSIFVDIEKFYNLKMVKENKDKPCNLKKLKLYIEESIKISELILEGKVRQENLFLFPHILSDSLFNKTGYESEEIVFHIRSMNAKDELDDSVLDMIVTEAYSVEKSKKMCFTKFDDQMQKMEEMYVKHMESVKKNGNKNKVPPPGENNPFEDKALMKMFQMGLNVPGMTPPQGSMPPGMLPSGMMPGMLPPGMMPGMMPPGMMPPGMMPPGMMPPGMMPPGMMPPGMMPPGMMPPGMVHQKGLKGQKKPETNGSSNEVKKPQSNVASNRKAPSDLINGNEKSNTK